MLAPNHLVDALSICEISPNDVRRSSNNVAGTVSTLHFIIVLSLLSSTYTRDIAARYRADSERNGGPLNLVETGTK